MRRSAGQRLRCGAGSRAPTGAFGDELGEDAGSAEMGFTVDADLLVPIRPLPGLDWASSITGTTFGVDERFLLDLGGDTPYAELEVGRYWGTLLFTGLQYGIDAGSGLSLYGVGQLGAGFFKAPAATFTLATDRRAELKTSWAPAKGLSVGVGVEVGDRLVLDARFVTLIGTELESELSYLGVEERLTTKQPVSWVQITGGLQVP